MNAFYIWGGGFFLQKANKQKQQTNRDIIVSL